MTLRFRVWSLVVPEPMRLQNRKDRLRDSQATRVANRSGANLTDITREPEALASENAGL